MITDKQKLSIEDFVDDLFSRYDISFEARTDAVLGYSHNTISRIQKILGKDPDKQDYARTISKLEEAEYSCKLMRQKLAIVDLGSLQRKLDVEIARIVTEKQKVYALWESPGTDKVIPNLLKAVAEENYDLAAALDSERCLRANFLTTAQFGQRLPRWPTEGSTVPDVEYERLS